MTHPITRRIRLWVFLAFSALFPGVNGAGAQAGPEPLRVQAYDGGSISIEDAEGAVALIEPKVFIKRNGMPVPVPKIRELNGDHMFFFEGDGTSSPGDLKGSLLSLDGDKVELKGSVTPVKNGLKITYWITPSAPVTVERICALVDLDRADWAGATGFIGATPVTLSSSALQTPPELRKPLIHLGPSLDGLWLTIKGSSVLGSDFQDELPWGRVLELGLDAAKVPSGETLWQAGVTKKLELTLSFNRPLQLASQTRETSLFHRLKAEMACGYPVPPDSQVIGEIAGCAGSGLVVVEIIPAWFKVEDVARLPVQDKFFYGFLVWDTGDLRGDIEWTFMNQAPRKINIVTITNQFLEKLGFKPQNDGRFEVGAAGQGKQNGTLIADTPASSVGPVKVQVRVEDLAYDNMGLIAGNLSISGPHSGKFNFGAFPYELMKNYIFSMDYKNQIIYLRPLDSARRTFFAAKPLAEIREISKGDGVLYFPLTVNGRFQGIASLDTGHDLTSLNKKKINLDGKPVTSFKIGDYDLMGAYPGFNPPLADYSELARTTDNPNAEDILSWLGNDAFQNLFVTFDPKNNKIYIERNN